MRTDLVVEPNAKGRGVYAARRFKHGEMVEDCPVLVLKPSEGRGLITYYWWAWKGRYGLALSVASIFNHSRRPNVGSRRHFKQQRMTFMALRDIVVGEEILVDYGVDQGFEIIPAEHRTGTIRCAR